MTRPELLADQWLKLTQGLARILPANRFYDGKFRKSHLTVSDLRSRDDLRRIPFTTKDEIVADQEAHGPYGSNLSEPIERYVRIHQTSGTSGRRLRWLDTAENWEWILTLWDEIYQAVDVRDDDRFFFPFSFGPFLGFWAAFEGACRRGNFTMAGGGMTSIARLTSIVENKVTIVGCTPTHALHLAEVAEGQGVELAGSGVRMLVLAGEPGASIPSVRKRIEESWGARVIDHSGMTEIASLGIEYASLPGKLFVLENHCIAEFVEPGGDRPVAEGELGELVITTLGRWGSPLLRYRTGDVCRWRSDVHPPERPFVYLDGGLIGRTDDMLWIKGNNVYPSALDAVLRAEPGVAEYRIEVDEGPPPVVCIAIEPRPGLASEEELSHRVGTSFQDCLYFRPAIRIVAPGSLPRHEMKAQRVVRTVRS